MAEILTEKTITQDNTARSLAKSRLEKFLNENRVGVFTEKDFDFPKDEETQSKIRDEVDEFMRMREEWRETDTELSKGREEL